MKSLDILVITHQRPELLREALLSIEAMFRAAQDLPWLSAVQVKVLINGVDDVSEPVIHEFQNSRIHGLSWEKIPRHLPGAARNVYLRKSQSQWILFLDDDVRVPEELLLNFASLTERYPQAHVLGGPNLTPKHANRFCQIQGMVLAHPLVTGPFSRRYRSAPVNHSQRTWSLTLCNLFVRREDADELFPEDFLCGEETSLLHKFRRRGFSFVSSPDLAVVHERRSTWGAVAQQMHKYGIGRGQTIQMRYGRVLSACAALSVIAGFAFASLLAAGPILMAIGFWHLVAAGSVWLQPSHSLRWHEIPWFIFLAMLIQASYALGLAQQLLRPSRIQALLPQRRIVSP